MIKIITFGIHKNKPLQAVEFEYYAYLYHKTDILKNPKHKYILDYVINRYGNIINKTYIKNKFS